MAGCLVAAVVVLALAAGGLLWVRQSLGNWTNPPAPDVSAVARSGPVDAADQAATRQLDSEIAKLQRLLPWAHPIVQGVKDGCSSQEHAASFGSRPTWSPVGCGRTVVWFGTIDGPLATTLDRIDSSLQHAGMRPGGTSINQLYAIDHARMPQLNSAYGSYGDGNFSVDITIDAPSDLQQATTQDRDLLVAAGPPTALPATVDRAYAPVQESELTTRVVPPAYVIGLRMSIPYFQQPSPATSAAN